MRRCRRKLFLWTLRGMPQLFLFLTAMAVLASFLCLMEVL